MRPPVPRFVRWAVALAVIAALTLAVFQYWGTSQYGTAVASGQAAGQSPSLLQTRWGPLSPADRDLLVMVRQAGISGGSSGKQAQQRGSNPQVRTVAKRIWVDYGDLDSEVRTVAGKLGVPLPDQPTAQQRGWLTELSGRSGAEYDRMFAQRLRVTDGEVLPVITAVRAGTRNELIRSFAVNAAVLVNRHMDVLERTGLVDYSRLPAPQSAAAKGSLGGPEQRIDPVVNVTPVPAVAVTGNNAMIAALISIAALLIALGVLGSKSGRRTQQRRHAAHRW